MIVTRNNIVMLLLLMHVISTSAMMAVNHHKNNNIRHIHFNNAGASPSPLEVTNAIIQHLQLETEVGGYHAASLVNLDKVYSSVAQLIGINNDTTTNTPKTTTYNPRDEIALVESATVAWTRVFYSMLETKKHELMSLQHQKKNKVSSNKKKELTILVSEAEYAANLVAAVKFARDHNILNTIQWRVIAIPSTKSEGDIPTGVIDLEALRSILKGTYPIGESSCIDPSSIVMVCITHIPTNAGIINPVNEIGQMIHEYNSHENNDESSKINDNTKLPKIMYLVDGCQSIGQIQVNVREMQCHALAATGRKYLRGPRGTGFLYVQKSIANILEPSHIDHAAAPVVRMPTATSAQVHGLEEDDEFGLSHTYQPGARRFEFWESNISTRLGLGAAIDVSLNVGMNNIEKKCASLGTKLRQQLHSIQGVKVYHDDSSACGIVTFSIDDMDVTIIKERLQNGVEDLKDSSDDVMCCFYLSVVPASSTPLDSTSTGLGDRRLLRASLSYFNTEDEIDLFCKALSYLVQVQSVVGE